MTLWRGQVRESVLSDFGLDLVNFGLSWGVKMTKDGANITLQCILMIYNS